MNLTGSWSPLSEEAFGVQKKMQNHMKAEEITLEPTTPLKHIYTPP